MDNFIRLSQETLARLYAEKPELRDQPLLQWFERVLALLSLYYGAMKVTEVVEPSFEIHSATANPGATIADPMLQEQAEFWQRVRDSEAKAKAVVDEAIEQYQSKNPEPALAIPVVQGELPIDTVRQTGASQLLGGGFSIGIDPKIRK